MSTVFSIVFPLSASTQVELFLIRPSDNSYYLRNCICWALIQVLETPLPSPPQATFLGSPTLSHPPLFGWDGQTFGDGEEGVVFCVFDHGQMQVFPGGAVNVLELKATMRRYNIRRVSEQPRQGGMGLSVDSFFCDAKTAASGRKPAERDLKRVGENNNIDGSF